MKKHRTSQNHTSAPEYTIASPYFNGQLWNEIIMPFLSTTDAVSTCDAFDWSYPMNEFKDRVESELRHHTPQLIEGLFDIVTETGEKDSIVIAGGSALSALFGTVYTNSDVDVWCMECYHPRIRKLLVSLGFVLSRISTRYGVHSCPLISHVETYFYSPPDGERFYDRRYREEEAWIFSDTGALDEGRRLINFSLHNSQINRILQFSSEDRTMLELRFEPRLWRSLCTGLKVDVIIAQSYTTPEEVIINSFDLSACLVRWSIGGDLRIEFPRFTLSKKSLFCPSDNRIVMMHYMRRLVDLSHLPHEAAIEKFARVPSWFTPFFNRHISEILLTLESYVKRGGFFARHLDRYSEYPYYEYWDLSMADQEFRRTIWMVVYYVRHYMIVDALQHVAGMRIGFVQHPSFRYDHDGRCDWAIISHNNICYSKNVDRLIKYAHRGFKILPIDMKDIHTLNVVREHRQL